MKSAMSSAFLAVGLMMAVYIGSYFLTVSALQVSVGSTVPGLRRYSVFATYWGAPAWLHAPSLYGPLHLLDEKYVRPAKWKPHVDTETTAPRKRPLNNAMHTDSAITLRFQSAITSAEPVMANR